MVKKILKKKVVQKKLNNLFNGRRYERLQKENFSVQLKFLKEKYFDVDDKTRQILYQNIYRLAKKDALKCIPVLYKESFTVNYLLDIAYDLFMGLSKEDKRLLGKSFYMNWTMFDEPFVACTQNEFNHLSKEQKTALEQEISKRNEAVVEGKTRDFKISMESGIFYRLHTACDYVRFKKTLEMMMESGCPHVFYMHGYND